MTRLLILAALALLLGACASAPLPTGGRLEHARLLRMEGLGEATLATVVNPWDTTALLHRYVLVAEGHSVPPDAPREATVVTVPLQRAVSTTSLHAHLALRLGALDRMAGVMDAPYIIAPELRACLKAQGGRLDDFGSASTPDVERLVAARADALFVSPFEHAGYGPLESLGVPLVECADYMETTPLGRAEWMRFYGRLLGKGAEADSIFAHEVSAYNALKDSISNSSADSPALLVGQRQGASWSVPAADSYLGHLYADAGARYVFADESASGSVALDFERAYTLGRDADVWIITYGAPAAMTYSTLLADDPRYARFRPYAEHHVWGCNTLEVPYYDRLPFAPSRLLRDLRAILRPQEADGHTPEFFRPLDN